MKLSVSSPLRYAITFILHSPQAYANGSFIGYGQEQQQQRVITVYHKKAKKLAVSNT